MRAGASPGSLPGLLSRALSSPAGFAHGRLRRTLPRTLPRTLQGFLPPPRCNIARNAPGNALRGPKPAAGFTARENVRAAACAFPKRAFAGSLPGSLPREMSPGPGQNAWQCTAEMHWRCRVPENGRAQAQPAVSPCAGKGDAEGGVSLRGIVAPRPCRPALQGGA